MKLKKKTLALMVGIVCSGLLYGANANAAAVVGFDSEVNTLNAINTNLTEDELNIGAEHQNLYVSNEKLASVTPAATAEEKAKRIENYEGYKQAAEDANTANKNWATEFNSYLSGSDNGKNGLLSKIFNNLKEEAGHLTVVGSDGKVTDVEITTANKYLAADTLLNLIDLAQQAKAADKAAADKDAGNNKGENYTAFLKKHAVNLQKLGIVSDNNGTPVTGTTAVATFNHLVDVSENGLSTIPVSKLRSNIALLKEANVILTGDVADKITVSNKVSGEQNGGDTDVLPAEATLATRPTLKDDLKNVGSNTVIASKGTKLGIKDNKITYKGDDLGSVDSTYSYVYLNGKFSKLGQVVIKDSNVQGEGNTVLAGSEVTVDEKNGSVYNLAKGMTVLGNGNTIESDGIAVGNKNMVGEKGIVVGNESRATAPGAIAFGNEATAEHANSVALGSGSKTTQENEINVGMWKRNDETKEYTQTGRTISGVANGEKADEAVNYGQLESLEVRSKDAANTYTDNKVNGLKQEMNGKIDALDKKVDKGFAANAALSGLFQPYGVGKINLTAGVGGYQSESAVAVGVGYRINENVAVKGGIATAVGNGSSTMYNASVNFEW